MESLEAAEPWAFDIQAMTGEGRRASGMEAPLRRRFLCPTCPASGTRSAPVRSAMPFDATAIPVLAVIKTGLPARSRTPPTGVRVWTFVDLKTNPRSIGPKTTWVFDHPKVRKPFGSFERIP